MKKYVLSIAFVAIAMVSCKENKKGKVEAKAPVKVEEQTAKEKATSMESLVNVESSVIEWIGSKPTESHNGTIKFTSGKLVISDDNKLTGGEFVVDMNSIKDLDVDSEEYRGKLENHLKGADFFDVEKYPTTKFVIASVEEKDGKLNVTGNLTIKDKTKSITFPASFKTTDAGYVFESESFKINRLDFDVTYKSKTLDAALKDKFINDLIEFKVKLESKK